MLVFFVSSSLLIAVGLAGFVYGVIIARYQTLSYAALLAFRDSFNSKATTDLEHLSINMGDIRSRAKRVAADTKPRRAQLIDAVILERSKVRVDRALEPDGTEWITASFYGIRINSYLEKSGTAPSKCLDIYIQGHDGDPFKFDYFLTLKQLVLADGCDILAMSMLGLGFNEGEASFPGIASVGSTINLTAEQAANHGIYALYYDPSTPNKDPLALFLSGHYYIIKTIAGGYDRISMIGLSGGGWYTTWLAALIPEVDVSVDYAGTLPLAYRNDISSQNDWEQIYSNIYRSVGYWDLYFLGALSDESKANRKVYLVYNDNDVCCYMNPGASHFKRVMDSLGFANIGVVIDKNHEHSINPVLAHRLLAGE
jgi:hypothetical protein